MVRFSPDVPKEVVDELNRGQKGGGYSPDGNPTKKSKNKNRKEDKGHPERQNGHLHEVTQKLLRNAEVTALSVAKCLRSLDQEDWDKVGAFAQEARTPVQRDALIAYIEHVEGESDDEVAQIMLGVRNGTYKRVPFDTDPDSEEFLNSVRGDPRKLLEALEEENLRLAEDL